MVHVPAHQPDVLESIIDRSYPGYLEHLRAPPDDWRIRKNWGLRAGWIKAMKAAGVAVMRKMERPIVAQHLVDAAQFGIAWMQVIAAGESRPVRVFAWNQWLETEGIRAPSEFIYPVMLDVTALGYWLDRPDFGEQLLCMDIALAQHPGLQIPAFREYVVMAWQSFGGNEPLYEPLRQGRNIIGASEESRGHAKHLDTPLLDAMDALNALDEAAFDDALRRILEGHRHRAEKHNYSGEYEDALCPLAIGLAALAEKRCMSVGVTSPYLAVGTTDVIDVQQPNTRGEDEGWTTIASVQSVQLKELTLTLRQIEDREFMLHGNLGSGWTFSRCLLRPRSESGAATSAASCSRSTIATCWSRHTPAITAVEAKRPTSTL